MPNQTKQTPFITVIMPVYNEEQFIEDTLSQILAQNYPERSFEVLVIDGMSSDKTPDIVKKIAENHSNIKLIKNKRQKSSSARNIGFRHGKGDFFIIIDGHCHIPSRTLFQDMISIFLQTDADCLCRPQPLNPPRLSLFQTAVALARASRIGHGGDSKIYCEYEGFTDPTSNGAMYRRTIFPKIGYVDETFDACEDVEFNYRIHKAGLKSYMSPKLTIKYYPRDSLYALWKQLVRYGVGRYRLYKKHKETMTTNVLIPPAFTLFAAISPLTIACAKASNQPLITYPLIMGWSIYWLIVLLQSIATSLKARNLEIIPLLPMIYLTIHLALGAGFVTECLRATHSPQRK